MAQRRMIFHADDFGANEEISRHILDCYREGALNSLSVLPNSGRFEACMEALAPYRKNVKISIHLNLAEGRCLAEPSAIPLLVDERGMFRLSFFQVLLLSFTGKRKELKRQIQAEMRRQLERALPHVDSLRIDSHQHYHMIPVVLESILSAVNELARTENGKRWTEAGHRAEIEFIRIPAEPIGPFLRHPSLYATYRPINLVKNIVLNTLYRIDRKTLRPYRKKSAVFFGILMSGKMDMTRVSKLLPDFQAAADKKGLPLEMLCHPGGVKAPDQLMDIRNKGCVEFYMSEGRAIEKHMMLHIREKESGQK